MRPAPWWAWPAMLSVEGVAFVLLARELAAPGATWSWATAGVAWLLWSGYALDRWLDGRWHPAATATWRHRFHARYGWELLGVACLGGVALALAVARGELTAAHPGVGPRTFGRLGRGAAAGLMLVFGQRWLGFGSWARLGLISSLLAFFATSAADGFPLAAFLAVFLLATVNLLVIRRAENGPGPASARLLPPVALLGCAACHAFGPPAGAPLTLACLAGVASLFWLDTAPSSGGPERRRAEADGLTLLCLAFALLLRR